MERGRSEAADARYFGRYRVQNALEPGHVAMAHEGNAGGDQGIGEVAPRRHAQATVLKPGALALFLPEAFVRQRLIDKSCDNRAARPSLGILQRDGNGEGRNPVKKVGGPVRSEEQTSELQSLMRIP